MKRLLVPLNKSRFAQSMATKAARAGVITHQAVKANPSIGRMSQAFHPRYKG